MRLLLLLALIAAGCSVLDPFDADRGSFTATVRGDQTFDLRGSGYYGTVSDEPPTSSILLTDTDEPAIEFLFPETPARAVRYTFPDDARATFELTRYTGSPYVATSGYVELATVTATQAEGTFSFTAERAGGMVTVEGGFVAERDVP